MSTSQGATAVRFTTEINRRTNGRLKIEIYPNGQLAQQQETIDALINGVIDFTIKASSYLGQLMPQSQVFDMPYLFKTQGATFRVLDGPIGNAFFADMESKGLIGLGWSTGGFRELFTTSKVVVVPEDLRGLRIRSSGGAVGSAMWQALGAIPLTIDLTEAYTALSQHTVDGIDLNIDTITTQKYYTIIKHVAMSNHAANVNMMMASKRRIDALPPDLQKIIREEGKAIVQFWRSSVARQNTDDIEILKKNGVAFTDIQYPLFRKSVEPVYTSIQGKLGGDMLERVSRAASAI